jgi:hypothetical protein
MGIKHLITALKNAVEAWRDAGEMRQLRRTAPDVAMAVARDAGTTPFELQQLAAAGRHAARLKERMLAAYGIEPETMGSAAYGALRQSGITCSHCRAKRRCALELERGTARANATFFCPNASTFDALTAEIGR